MTGMDDSYEPPDQPEISVDTTNLSPADRASQVLSELYRQGRLRTNGELPAERGSA